MENHYETLNFKEFSDHSEFSENARAEKIE